jgi:hypothetical protein
MAKLPMESIPHWTVVWSDVHVIADYSPETAAFPKLALRCHGYPITDCDHQPLPIDSEAKTFEYFAGWIHWNCSEYLIVLRPSITV